MKKAIITIVAAASMIVSGFAMGVEVPAVGKAKCGACHTLDKKTVGPSLMDIAAKFKGDKDAVSKMTASITKGGSFGWKIAAMPARGLNASDAEIKTMAEFIAGLAK